MLKLQYEIEFYDLYKVEGLEKLDSIFLSKLKKYSNELFDKLFEARSTKIVGIEESELILELSQFLELFIAQLFSIESDIYNTKESQKKLDILFFCKKTFIQKRVSRQLALAKEEIDLKIDDALKVLEYNNFPFDCEVSISKRILRYLEENNLELINAAEVYAAYKILNHNENSILFKLPKKIDDNNLVEFNTSKKLRNRNGFSLNDEGLDIKKALSEAKYCIHCHKQGKDSCSKGLRVKDSDDIQTNNQKNKLAGCPLKQKISEMNLLKSLNFLITPLAVAVIDNPMLAATGHRICNDCMKSCIYQKQDPVNIPLIESQILNDTLNLRWGFEIYSLLTRWNPLNFSSYIAKKNIDRNILIAGLGPSGFTLAHYLLNEGCNVVAVDGLKIEPLPNHISGIDQNGQRTFFTPIEDINTLYEDLGERTPGGFGGVAEYGITVRWNKNYLKIIRLLIERRENFRMYGSTRFGSSITLAQARNLGFHHVALALGSGTPNIPKLKNIMAKGVRSASDFLMSLHLGGLSRKNSIANLHIELPIVVIGGGLTAIDTATEALNYYAIQVEKTLQKYEILKETIFEDMNQKEISIIKIFLEHAKKLRSQPHNKSLLLKNFGGSSIAYRKKMVESPAYRLNHEEVQKALEEGIEFIEDINPLGIEVDEENSVIGLRHETGFIPARTILFATGTNPNTILASEDLESFSIAENRFIDTDYYTSFGDLDPKYSGNVVKAMASAKYGYKNIVDKVAILDKTVSKSQLFQKLDYLLIAKVKEVKKIRDGIVEVVVQAPIAAQNFLPGQFYKMQNYEANSSIKNGMKLAMEPIALTGAYAEPKEGVLSMIVLETGGSADLCKLLKKSETIPLMGPTGTATYIPKNKKVLLIGGGLGNAVLFSIGKAMRENGCHVLYFAGYRQIEDRFKEEEIENASDVIVWVCENGLLKRNRDQDFSFQGNIVEALIEYKNFDDRDYLLVIGSDSMMQAVASARYKNFPHLFKSSCSSTASVNSPMQCMMKGICAQCIQRHYDYVTDKEFYVYSCVNQDQELSTIDFQNLSLRLKQNQLAEKLTKKLIKF